MVAHSLSAAQRAGGSLRAGAGTAAPLSVHRHYELYADPARVRQAIEQARQARAEDETWPQLHYLWPQHPIVDWLVDCIITLFGRHRAPVIQNHHLQPGEEAFVMMGLVPNRKGQPLLIDWQVVCR